MIRQFTTHSSLLLLLVGLVGCTHAPSKPALDSSRNPELVTPDLYPSGAPSEREVRYGRYTLVNTAPGIEQRDLMAQIIDINIPANLRPTVRDAMQYVLNRSGYSLCGPETPHVNILFTRPLPAAQYKIGPMSLRNTLQVLAGPAWQVKVDEVMRNVCFVLRPGYQLPDPPRSALATLPPATAPSTSPAPTPAKSTPTAVVTTAVPSVKPLATSTATAGTSGGQTPAAPVSRATAAKPAPTQTSISAPAPEAAKTTVAATPQQEPAKALRPTAPVSAVAQRPATSLPSKPVSNPPATSALPLRAPLKPVWEARAGSTLRESVEAWARSADYRVIWECDDLDYAIEAPLRFSGSFAEAVTEIFPLWDNARRSFLVDGNPDQRIVHVSERKKKK